ncbi:unnamed protein product [Strongylus vulgaris]|uniref:SCP domain-containing protein n=1 Tax=Strongylus vulgaris TaxID=40348 RepID=A0A3P7J243_STRVU|nr:unnamed protein product [Strongylus vulgaris]
MHFEMITLHLIPADWDCALEEKAIAVLPSRKGEKTIQCLGKAELPPASRNNTVLFVNVGPETFVIGQGERTRDYEDFDISEPINRWIRPMFVNSMSREAIGAEAVTYQGEKVIEEYVNLVRADTTKIGCAWVRCFGGRDAVYSAYCLTNKA